MPMIKYIPLPVNFNDTPVRVAKIIQRILGFPSIQEHIAYADQNPAENKASVRSAAYSVTEFMDFKTGMYS
jgi:hypothetical protein